jgi:hypothetical protein
MLSPRFYGPFKILEKIGEVAYKLQLPSQSKIHPVFHVSLLKRAIGDYQAEGELPKELDVVLDEGAFPVKVLGSRVTTKAGITTPQSLIQWSNKSIEDVTWEDNAVIKGQFPDFNLEDKVLTEGGGIDRNGDIHVGLEYGPKPKIWRVYERKRVKGKKSNDVAGILHGMHETHLYN